MRHRLCACLGQSRFPMPGLCALSPTYSKTNLRCTVLLPPQSGILLASAALPVYALYVLA